MPPEGGAVAVGQVWKRDGDRLSKRIQKVGRVYAHFSYSSPILNPSRIRLDALVRTHKLIREADRVS